MATSSCENWSTWMDLSRSYKESRDKIREYRQQLRKQGDDKTAEELMHLELAGSMERDLNQTTAEMEKRVLYQLGAMGEQEIKEAGLTERQKEVALLRMRYSYTEIANMLHMKTSSIFSIYQDAIKKIKNYKLSVELNQPCGLGARQMEIYRLYKDGKSKNEIAKELGVSINTIKTQLRIIKQKQNKGG